MLGAVGGLTKANDQQELTDRLLYVLDETLRLQPSEADMRTPTKVKGMPKRNAMIGAVASVVKAFLSYEERLAPKSLFEVMCKLHDEIQAVQDSPSLQNDLCELCELWFLQDRSSKDAVAPQMVTFLLAKSLANDSKVVDVKRVFNVREALTFMDWEDPTSNSLRIMIQRAYLHAQYLTSVEGKKFLVWSLSSLPLVSILHKTIKVSLAQDCPKWKTLIYANLYYKAWKKAQGQAKLRIESVAIQNLIDSALHCQSASLLKTIKTLLKHIIDQKAADKDVEELLHRLYSPLIFRALEVANPVVRENALYQMSLVFPLVPPALPQGEFDQELQNQFHLLVDAMDDPVPQVRVQAVLSVGRILSLFWELLPTQSLQIILEYLVNELAFDKASPNVREAIFRVCIGILDNPLSHRLLQEKGYLAKLSPLIFDSSEKVRAACVSLLEAVKKIKKIKYYEVVDFDRLLEALAHESSPKIQIALTKVLQASYWPFPRYQVDEIFSRAISLISSNPAAAVAFYSHVAISDPNVAVQFMIRMWTRIVVSAIPELEKLKKTAASGLKGAKKAASKRGKATGNGKTVENEENESNDDEEIDDEDDEPAPKRAKASELPVTKDNILSAVRIVAAVWDQIEELLKDVKSITALIAVFKDAHLVTLQSVFPHPAITGIAARLSPDQVQGFAQGVLDLVLDPKGANANGSLYETQQVLLPCIFSWSGFLPQFMKSICEYLEKGSSVHIVHALRLLQTILVSGEWLREALFALPELSARVIPHLKTFEDKAKAILAGEDTTVKSAAVLEALAFRLKLLLHVSTKDDSLLAEIKRTMTWIDETVMTKLKEETREDELDRELEDSAPTELHFPLRLLAALALTINDYHTLHSGDEESKSSFWNLIANALKVRADSQVLELFAAIGWKLLVRLPVEPAGCNLPKEAFTLLVILRDPSARKRLSVNALRALSKTTNQYDEIVLANCWSMMAAQLPDDGYSFEVDLLEGLPAEVDVAVNTFSGSSVMIASLAKWLKAKLAADRSNASVWTTIQIATIMTREVKRIRPVNYGPLKNLLSHLFASMKEADEVESVLRARLDQLLKSPSFK